MPFVVFSALIVRGFCLAEQSRLKVALIMHTEMGRRSGFRDAFIAFRDPAEEVAVGCDALE